MADLDELIDQAPVALEPFVRGRLVPLVDQDAQREDQVDQFLDYWDQSDHSVPGIEGVVVVLDDDAGPRRVGDDAHLGRAIGAVGAVGVREWDQVAVNGPLQTSS